jgi:hypothetical protein
MWGLLLEHKAVQQNTKALQCRAPQKKASLECAGTFFVDYEFCAWCCSVCALTCEVTDFIFCRSETDVRNLLSKSGDQRLTNIAAIETTVALCLLVDPSAATSALRVHYLHILLESNVEFCRRAGKALFYTNHANKT